MLLNFYAFYYTWLLLLNYWNERQLYLFGILTIRNRIDTYSYSFLFLLRIVGGCVCVWSYYYMDNEESYNRFVLLLRSFLICMILLIVFSNLFMALVGWDGLGLTSFLLVIFYKNRKCLGSGLITAISNRIGDCFLFCSLGFVLYQSSTLLLTIIIILRMTKRAQFPFSAWLPAAIAAPTPVRALVHSSTLVTAGVYVLIRYSVTDTQVMLIVGSITILIAGLVACAESDIKKVVALRTLSQLGVMIFSLGAQEKSYCFFHLISHAWFKALLFLCVGVCIHSIYGSQDFRSFNILNSTLTPSVFATIASVSLLGFVFTSGFYRKDMILEVTYKEEFRSSVVSFFLLGIGLTTCYTIKLIITTMSLNDYTGTNDKSIGGLGWEVKAPLYLLATFRLIFGACAERFSNQLRVVLNPMDKIVPYFLITGGTIVGYYVSRFSRVLLCRIFTRVPNRQALSYLSVDPGDNQKVVDKGWVEAGTLRIRWSSNSVVRHYTPAYCVGLRVLFILNFYYDQYLKSTPDAVSWNRRGSGNK